MPQWEVYIVATESGKLYTGITNDFARRFKEHQGKGGLGAKFFNLSPPQSILFREAVPDRASASRREAAIKRLTRQQKLDLIGAHSRHDPEQTKANASENP